MERVENKGEAVIQAHADEEKKDILVISLGDAFLFEGSEIKELNLDGLLEMTAADLCAIDRQMMIMGYTGGNL
ncbi:MAG: hypothetical protein RR614_11820, partial [Eubacterium sp.]